MVVVFFKIFFENLLTFNNLCVILGIVPVIILRKLQVLRIVKEKKTMTNEIQVSNQPTLSRNFFIVTYLSDTLVHKALRSLSVAHWAYILHDKDDKEPHIHLLVRLNNKTTTNAVRKKFNALGAGADNGKDINSFVEYSRNLSDSFEYLIHANDKDKYQYSIDDVVTDDMGYWRGTYSSAGNPKSAEHSIENNAYQILCDLEKGVSLREMAKRYGREFIINRFHYVDYFELMKQQEHSRRIDNERLEILEVTSNEQLDFDKIGEKYESIC